MCTEANPSKLERQTEQFSIKCELKQKLVNMSGKQRNLAIQRSQKIEQSKDIKTVHFKDLKIRMYIIKKRNLNTALTLIEHNYIK